MTDERHVPGLLQCPKCHFTLQSNLMHSVTGAVAVDRSPKIEACPNKTCPNEIMEPVTWKQYCAMADVAFRSQLDRALAAEDMVVALESAIKELRAGSVRGYTDEIKRLHGRIAALEQELNDWKNGPVPELNGCFPLVLYFKTQQDSDEFVKLVQAAKLNFKMRNL